MVYSLCNFNSFTYATFSFTIAALSGCIVCLFINIEYNYFFAKIQIISLYKTFFIIFLPPLHGFAFDSVIWQRHSLSLLRVRVSVLRMQKYILFKWKRGKENGNRKGKVKRPMELLFIACLVV